MTSKAKLYKDLADDIADARDHQLKCAELATTPPAQEPPEHTALPNHRIFVELELHVIADNGLVNGLSIVEYVQSRLGQRLRDGEPVLDTTSPGMINFYIRKVI